MSRLPMNTVAACKPNSRTGRSRKPRKASGAAAIACFAITLFVHAQGQISEYAVKAAYLFNFGKFLRFSPSPLVQSRPAFDICVVGEDPMGRTLDELTANEQLDGKPVRVLRFRSALDAGGCAIAYISAAEGDRIGNDLAALRGHETLTVSDSSDFLRRGGMIQFVNIENHVRFAVNLSAVQSARISLSSELLKVAISVKDEGSPEVRP